MGKFLLALLLSVPAFAQEGAFNNACFQGLNDADSPATLNPCESPDLLNTESNLAGTAILKRKGFQLFGNLAITTSAVNGSHSFIDSSGNRLDIVCADRYCSKSTNGNAFATFLSTAGGIGAVPTRWSFVDQGGILYGANNRRDAVLKYDGTSLTFPAGMPQGSILELSQGRLIVGDINGNPNRVHYSSAGAYEQFTTGVNREDSWFDDIGAPGDKIRGLKCLFGICFIFKTASITACEVDNQYSTRCSVLSPNLGTTDPSSIIAAGSSVYFRAQDKNYWEINSQGLRQISKKIPNLVKSQSGGLGGGENSNTQTTQADWQAGVQSPTGTYNTTAVNGSVFPSSITFVDTSSADWNAAASLLFIDTLTASGSIQLTSTTAADTWASGLTSGALGWTTTAGTWTVDANLGNNYIKSGFSGGCVSDLNSAIDSTSINFTSGSWKFSYLYSAQAGGNQCSVLANATSGCFSARFEQNAGGDYYELLLSEGGSGLGSSTKPLAVQKTVAGVTTLITSTTITGVGIFNNTSASIYSFEVKKSTDGKFAVYYNNAFVLGTAASEVAITSSTRMRIVASGCSSPGVVNEFTGLNFYQYQSSGAVVSRTFDTAFSTPTWGNLSSTFTLPSGEGNVNFYTQTSADGSTWSTYTASSDTLRNLSPARRYGRYKVEMFTFISTKTPTISEIALNAATTGFFTTQCIQPNSSISAWGDLNCGTTLTGAGSLVFFATSAATCATLPTTDPGSWQTSVSNNATLSISTNAAVKVGWRSLLGSATDQAQVDVCVLNWNEGTPAQPAWAAYDSIKNAIYWTTTINGASSSNRLLKYDRNLEQWYPFDIPAQAPRSINNVIYFGGASSGTWNLYGGVDADLGASINAYWKSKDVGSDSPFREKDFRTLSILSANSGSGNLTGTYTFSNAETGNYTISLTTGTGINYARNNYNLPKTSPHDFINVQVGNNNTTPFQVLGIGLTWFTKPFIVNGP